VPDSLLPTGAKAGCETSEGAFDLVGNLHEWTADPTGHFRGGYYMDTWLNGKGCDYVTTAHEARYWDYSTGFRCCADLSAEK
jgi:formylglycine-generating enzyme required for sulfatase activity